MAISDREISNGKARDRPYRLFDGNGLYIELLPSGAKYWRLNVLTDT